MFLHPQIQTQESKTKMKTQYPTHILHTFPHPPFFRFLPYTGAALSFHPPPRCPALTASVLSRSADHEVRSGNGTYLSQGGKIFPPSKHHTSFLNNHYLCETMKTDRHVHLRRYKNYTFLRPPDICNTGSHNICNTFRIRSMHNLTIPDI